MTPKEIVQDHVFCSATRIVDAMADSEDMNLRAATSELYAKTNTRYPTDMHRYFLEGDQQEALENEGNLKVTIFKIGEDGEDADEPHFTATFGKDGDDENGAKLRAHLVANDDVFLEFENEAEAAFRAIGVTLGDDTLIDETEEVEEIEERIEANSHWFVSDWLAVKLKEKGEIVSDEFFDTNVWGRVAYNQSIESDGVIEQIAAEDED